MLTAFHNGNSSRIPNLFEVQLGVDHDDMKVTVLFSQINVPFIQLLTNSSANSNLLIELSIRIQGKCFEESSKDIDFPAAVPPRKGIS